MGAVVASLTINSTVPGGLAIQSQGGIVTGTVAADVAAFRFAQPWVRVLSHHGDITMAIGTIHGKILRHSIA